MTELKPVTSLDELRDILKNMPGFDTSACDSTKTREPQLTKPPGSLGRLEDISAWLASWQGRHPPRMETPRARIFAGNHGVVAKGVSAYPAEVTRQMVYNFEAGGAAINQLCQTFAIELAIEALDLDTPTADFTEVPAMSEAECVAAINSGMASVPDDTDVLCLGEMGIGNTTSAAALCLALYGDTAENWTGAGTGVEGEAFTTKVNVVREGAKRHKPVINDGLDALTCLGGRELAAITGAVVAARLKRIPAMLDGYISTAAGAVLEATSKGALDHCMIAHASQEPGHGKLIEALGKRPLLDMDMRLGEGSGAALAVGILKAAVNCHNGMATFAEAGVSDKD